ncbi:MAG: hypothetical protein AB8G22_07995 [Saprospiraceae bacterium]
MLTKTFTQKTTKPATINQPSEAYLWSILWALAFLLPLLMSSCNQVDDISGNVDDAIRVLDNGIDRIAGESQSWRYALEEVRSTLPEGFHNIKEEIGMLLNEGLGASTSSVICIVDAIPKRMIRGLEGVKASLLGFDSAPAPPTVCQTSMAIIDLNLPEFSRRKLVLNGYDFTNWEFLKLELFALDANETMDITTRLTKQSNYQYTINLAGIDDLLLKYHSLRVVFNNEIISEFALIKENAAERRMLDFVPADLLQFCPDHIAGDDKLGSDDTRVKVNAEIFTVNQTEVWVHLSYDVFEPDGDNSEAQGDWQVKIYPTLDLAPPTGDYKITRIVSPDSSSASYVDSDETVDLPAIQGALVRTFRCQADTNGGDLGHCEGDESSNLSVVFNPIRIEIEQ